MPRNICIRNDSTLTTVTGLVGGWIVQQLLLRGEDPKAIRIFDLRSPTRRDILDNKVGFTQTDVTSPTSVSAAFNESADWSRSTAKLPLTVFHCVAFIGASDRHPLALDTYLLVNTEGTSNVLQAAQFAGCDIFIATSSGSISLTPPTYLPLIPRLTPKDYLQFLPNAEPIQHHLLSPLEAFGSCYAFSKARAEHLVRSANHPPSNFRTGCIRPAHAIYGHGVENINSVSYDYLRRGGTPTWLAGVVTHFVDARNVSLGHLWYEDALLKEAAGEKTGKECVSGKAYAITDPNPPATYGDLYRLFTLLAHPSTPCNFPAVPPIPLLLVAYVVEAYSLLLRRWGGVLGKVLPAPKGDLAALQPAIYYMCTAHFIYDDEMAIRELGYRGAVGTLRGLLDSVVEWNGKVEAKLKAKDGKSSIEERDRMEKEKEADGDVEVKVDDVVGEDGMRRRKVDLVQIPAVKM